MAAGADKSLRSSTGQLWLFRCSYFSPNVAARSFSTAQFHLLTAMTTIRLFTDEIDFAEADGDGWAALLCIKNSYTRAEPDPAKRSTKSDLFVWLLQLFSQEIRANFVEKHYAHVLKAAFGPGRERVARLLIELGPVNAIDTVENEGGFTALQVGLVEPGCPNLERILAFDPDIHHLGFEPSHSQAQETPFSLALYASQPFRRFADALNERNIDLDDFVLQELWEHSPLMEDGWTRQKLRALFDHEFEPDVAYTGIEYCDECGRGFIEAVQVEIAWQHHLEQLKEWHLRTTSDPRESHTDLVGKSFEDTSHDQTSMDLMQDFDDFNNGLEPHAWPETDSSGDSSSASEPAERERDRVAWEGSFSQHTVVCVHCWQKFKHGVRNPRSTMQNDSAEEDNNSEEDFSPYLFNI